MIQIEQKKSRNTTYYYLVERVLVQGTYKKIQVFLGKNVPTDLDSFYSILQTKEAALLPKKNLYPESTLQPHDYRKIEEKRLQWKYITAQMTKVAYERMLNHFAISFIYESNAIEGSRLSEDEVASIVRKQYIKKSLPRHEVKEAINAIHAFTMLQENQFSLTQKHLKELHRMVTDGLDIPPGFKKVQIVVNNKTTTPPLDVKTELNSLFSWYKNSKKNIHPFERALLFHNRFEHIHPFTDGNGRVGRLILNWMLIKDGYGPILFRHRNRFAYFSALDKGDEGRYRNLLTLAGATYSDTIDSTTSGGVTR
jgi:fido (protein-threonine AMPylation protein)